MDGCEILHHQQDGWNPINNGMFTTYQLQDFATTVSLEPLSTIIIFTRNHRIQPLFFSTEGYPTGAPILYGKSMATTRLIFQAYVSQYTSILGSWTRVDCSRWSRLKAWRRVQDPVSLGWMSSQDAWRVYVPILIVCLVYVYTVYLHKL